MRDIPQEMAARIESGAATLCHVWLLTRLDGHRMGFTDACFADDDLTLCRTAFGDQLDFNALLEALTQWQDAKLAELDARRNELLAAAALRALEGNTP